MTKPTFNPCPKRKPYRDPHLLRMAKGMNCLLNVPGVCNHDPQTTVACHSNLSTHGKGMSQKAHDAFTVCGCSSCHAWLDRGMGAYEEKEARFMRGHRLQIQQWHQVVESPYSTKKDKESAKAAIEFVGRYEYMRGC